MRPLVAQLTLASGKKLKRRLEDLERRAASTSASPEQSYQELAQPDERAGGEKHRQSSRGPSTTTTTAQRRLQQSPEPVSREFRRSREERTTAVGQRQRGPREA